MNYSKIKEKIQDTGSELLSLVSTKKEDYTHQPTEEWLILELGNIIEDLEEIHKEIKDEQ